MDKQIFDQKVMEKIKKEKIKPRSRLLFLVKNYSLWAAGGLALIVSAASFSLMVYLFQYNDYGLRREINKSALEILFHTMPYFWIIFLAIFVFLLYYNIRHTKHGYRYPLWLMIVASVSASIFLGGAFSLAGWDEKLDGVLGQSAPLYSQVMNPQLDFWSHPEDGRLVGIVVGTSSDNNLILVDRDNKSWEIKTETIENAINSETATVGLSVRLLGQQVEENEFLVEQVLPMRPGQGFFRRFHQGNRPLPPGLDPDRHPNGLRNQLLPK